MGKGLFWLWGVGAALMLFACEKQEVMDRPEAESLRLEKLYHEIDSLAALYPCENSAEWHFTAIGAKPCGGPTGYIAYSERIDTVGFLDKVALYTELQQLYNEKWDVVSDCMVLLAPSRVVCEGGKAKLVWDDQPKLSLPN